MRHRLERHLVPDGRPAATASAEESLVEAAHLFVRPPELGWRDYLVMLLQLGAEIEHALMVEYLYAAYSLGGTQVPAEHRDDVREWRDRPELSG